MSAKSIAGILIMLGLLCFVAPANIAAQELQARTDADNPCVVFDELRIAHWRDYKKMSADERAEASAERRSALNKCAAWKVVEQSRREAIIGDLLKSNAACNAQMAEDSQAKREADIESGPCGILEQKLHQTPIKVFIPWFPPLADWHAFLKAGSDAGSDATIQIKKGILDNLQAAYENGFKDAKALGEKKPAK